MIQYGESDAGSCPTYLDAIDVDYNTDLYISGRTVSVALINSITPSRWKCQWGNVLANTVWGADYVGYVVKFVSGTKAWGRFFNGNNDSSGDAVESLPWV